MKSILGDGFAKAMAAASAAGAAAMATGAGYAGEGTQGVNSVTISSSGAKVSVEGIGGIKGTVSGVTIVGGKVWIDGEELPDGVTAYTAPSGRKYKIQRDNGRVNVTSE